MGHTEQTRATEMAKRRQRRAEWFAQNGPCQHCGSGDHLEAHHVNPKRKVSHNVWSWSAAARARELAKCIALCHACHVALHRALRQPAHGTPGRYKLGCRCSLCRLIARVTKNIYRQQRKAVDPMYRRKQAA